MTEIIKALKLNQPSTWRGLVGILGSFGVVLSPVLAEQIIAICVAGIGVIEVVRNEKSDDDNSK